MSKIELELSDEADIIRVYVRYPGEKKHFSTLRSKDFARNMTKHSGISVWILSGPETRQKAIKALGLNPAKIAGTAICKAKALKGLGLKFVGEPKNAHIAARCAGCDMSVVHGQLCKTLDGTDCGLELTAQNSICETMTHPTIFVIDQAIV